MIPFHRIYSFLFKSFDINSETDTIKRLQSDGIERIMIIKRSWIFALAMFWIPLTILALAGANIWIALQYYSDEVLRFTLIGGVSISVMLFIISVVSYIRHFRKIYDIPNVRNDISTLIEELEQGDRYFIRFFNQTILNQWILLGLIVWGIGYYVTHTNNDWNLMVLVDGGLLFIEWFLLGRYRKRMMDLEMDYNIIIPGKIIFVNQSGMLSSSHSVEWEKVKTVSAKYSGWIGSFFHYGTIEIMTEGDSASLTGTMPMYYVTDPNETARLIQSLLEKDTPPVVIPAPIIHPTSNPPIAPSTDRISSKEHAYDTREKIRDVLR